MLTNYKPVSYEPLVWYELTFDDGRGNGCVFPCNEQGELLPDMNDGAKENYKFCMAHPEKFKRFNKVVRCEQRAKNNATGTCACGQSIELYNQFMGACECPNCGRWYNLFGQELDPPGTWASGEDW